LWKSFQSLSVFGISQIFEGKKCKTNKYSKLLIKYLIIFENPCLGSREEAELLRQPKHHIGALPLPIILDLGAGTSIRLAGKQLSSTAGHNPHL
jgi:hypothetical protein